MTLNFWLLYCSTLFLASIIPGPSMLLALNHGMRFGAKRTVATALGNVTASLIQALVSVAGLGALLIASEKLFLGIKWCGALYLIYIGVTSFLSSDDMVKSEEKSDNQAEGKPLAKMFGEAFLVAMGNPKAIIFFSALFPQFINMETINLLEITGALGTLAVIAFICFMLYAFGGEKIIAVFKKNAIGKWFNKIIGTTFIGSGIAILVKR